MLLCGFNGRCTAVRPSQMSTLEQYCSSAVPLANRMTSSRPTCLSVCLSVRVENFSETSAQLEEGNNLPRSKPLSTGGFFVAGLRGLWIGFT